VLIYNDVEKQSVSAAGRGFGGPQPCEAPLRPASWSAVVATAATAALAHPFLSQQSRFRLVLFHVRICAHSPFALHLCLFLTTVLPQIIPSSLCASRLSAQMCVCVCE
jgi:hypothetical protein